MLDKRRRDRDRPKRIRSEELRNGKSLEKNKWDKSVHLHPDGSLICRGKWVCGIQGSASVYISVIVLRYQIILLVVPKSSQLLVC